MKYKFLILFCLLQMSFPSWAQIDIWEGTDSHKRVLLTPVLPEGEPRAAIIVCPGGSYYWHDTLSEGSMVAEWLASNGIAAYVLEYRVAGVGDFLSGYRVLFRGNRHPDMISDLQRAICIIMEGFSGPVGVMGFSAGGHLVLSSGEFSNTSFVAGADHSGGALRPDFIAAIYPVVTLSDEAIVHKRSRRGLLGENRVGDAVMRDSLSLEKHVPPSMPPVFLLNCVDDPVVDYRNSVVMHEALEEANIPNLYLQFKEGGHGFGANPQKMTPETSTWQQSFLDWLLSIK